ncbi:ABC transporter ATP-binding protein [Orrella sp. 11846]|uniref:ABC transporter ATP-binding protein n=1 Tax=Orrella sp. 11846 TaxID=3409913 RepID=UPI003B5CE80C
MSQESSNTAVRFTKVTKVWGQTIGLHPMDLTLEEGDFSVLLGPSGCGKTTTLRLIAGLETPSEGRIDIFEEDVTHTPSSGRGVSMVFQNYALFPHLSVAENVAFGLRIRKTPAAEIETRLKRNLDMLGLSHLRDRKPGQLSGGQQQRVALARALVANARLCLMDEPLSNLDAKLRQTMREELRAIQQNLGLSVVYVTHDQTEAMTMADQVVLLKDGRIEQKATPATIYQQPASLFAAQFIGSSKMNVLSIENGRIAGSDVVVDGPPNAKHLGIRPEDIHLEGQTACTVQNTEFIGADLLLHTQIGDQALTVRAPGKSPLQVNSALNLGWQSSDQHWFDANGIRL